MFIPDLTHAFEKFPVQRVRKTALALARDVSGTVDLLVVELAALLHDVLDKKYVSAELAADPLTFFTPFFESVREHVDLFKQSHIKGPLFVQILQPCHLSQEPCLERPG